MNAESVYNNHHEPWVESYSETRYFRRFRKVLSEVTVEHLAHRDYPPPSSARSLPILAICDLELIGDTGCWNVNTYKVHLDEYNNLALWTGKTEKSMHPEIFCKAIRHDGTDAKWPISTAFFCATASSTKLACETCNSFALEPTMLDSYGPRELTDRELRVVSLIADGLKNKDIAAQCGTSEHIIKNSLRVIYDKLGMWNRTEVALWYVAHQTGPN